MKNEISKRDASDLLQISVLTILILLFLAFFAGGCNEKCEEVTTSVVDYVPVWTTSVEIKEQLGYEAARIIEQPGKIYFKDGYIYINEVGKGIHVIDNRVPSDPRTVGFINIPGNYDLAAKGNFLYADSYVDLVVLNITDPANVQEQYRLESAFSGYDVFVGRIDATTNSVMTEWEEVTRDFTYLDCPDDEGLFEDDFAFPEGRVVNDAAFFQTTALSASNASAAPSAGVGGSMARFTIYNDYLYTVNSWQLQLFDISDLDEPEKGSTVELGWGIETIFPYGDKLFIGANNGMHIYDNVNPEQPTWISTFQHVTSCDPVVVQGNYAYVTLRSGTQCQGFINQLDVVDISDLSNPQLFKTYPMQNPHGLGIDGSCLFITEGEFGLKYFDATDLNTIDRNMVQAVTNINAIDVIPLGGNLMVIGSDGFYQYEYNCVSKQMNFLSSIAVSRL